MIPVHSFKDKEVAVFGLGLSGISAAKSLLEGGAKVAAYDDRETGRAAAVKYGIPYVDLNTADWRRFAALILSPGVPLTHPEPHWTVQMATKAGAEIIGDTELFCRAMKESGKNSKLIAITGTNGKSTTTALIHHCLKFADRNTALGGNIGTAVLELDPFEDDRIYVLELSSYQLDLTPSLQADVAIHLNITPDHLDRHGSLEGYAAVKAKIFNGLEPTGLAVVGIDDKESNNIADNLNGDFAVCPMSAKATPVTGIHFGDGFIEYLSDGARDRISLEGIETLRGSHNAQNASAAYAASKHVGLSSQEIEGAFKSFGGLEHRMEVLGYADDVLFVNDSKATNADATAKALTSFSNIYWIAGGVAKDGGIESLNHIFPKLAEVYLIGECASDFAKTLGDDVAYKQCGTVDNAVRSAYLDASRCAGTKPVILLSPAAASFDQFPNFMERGDAFKKAVRDIEGFKQLKT